MFIFSKRYNQRMQSIAELRAAVKEQELIVQARRQMLNIENTRLNGLVKKLQDTILDRRSFKMSAWTRALCVISLANFS